VITVLGLTPEAVALFGDIKADLRKKGLLIEDMDLLIAATAREHDLTLVTNNASHFERIPDLRLENWVEL
jgi:tRNA(fMet)-specific endonuclease VapC